MNEPDIDIILEAATADCFWVSPEIHVVDRPELSYLHAHQPSLDLNRVLRARPSQADPQALIDEVLKAHDGRPSRWSLNPLSDTAEMRRLLLQAGYEESTMHWAYATDATTYDRRTSPDIEVQPVETIDDLRVLYQICRSVFGLNRTLTDKILARELAECTGPTPRIARFIAYRNGVPAGSGGMTFFDDLNFSLVWAGGVIEEHRGHGVYTALLAARARAAVRRGLTWFGLYAREDTSAPIVDAHGFKRYGHLVYFERT